MAGTHRASGQECAEKIVNVTKADTTSDGRTGRRVSESKRQAARNEVDVWERIGQHPNLIQLLESYEAMGNCFMVMKRCECNLSQKLDRDPSFFELDPGRVLRDMLLGIQACHRFDVVHRDVKLQNFLVGGAGDRASVKLCDFGLAAVLPPRGQLLGECGTAPMMSPEMVLQDSYGLGTDVWSFGASAYVALFKEFVYVPEEMTVASAKSAILRAEPPRWLDEGHLHGRGAVVALLRTLIVRDPFQRPTAKQALAHPYLTMGQDVCASDGMDSSSATTRDDSNSTVENTNRGDSNDNSCYMADSIQSIVIDI